MSGIYPPRLAELGTPPVEGTFFTHPGSLGATTPTADGN